VHSEYLESYAVPAFSASDMQQFHNYAGPIFKRIKLLANKNKKLEVLRITLLGLLANRGSL